MQVTRMVDVKLSKREKESFSLADIARGVDGIHREISEEMYRAAGLEPQGARFRLPLSVFGRDLNLSAGGAIVATDNVGLIDLLRDRSAVLQAGVSTLSNLVGNVTMPKMTAGVQHYWLPSEDTPITETQPTLGQLSLSPKALAALVKVSHQLLDQSSVEVLLQAEFAKAIAQGVDAAALAGTGLLGQPTGLLNTSGIGTVSGTSLGATGLLEAQTDLAANKAQDGQLGYVTTPTVAALLMARHRVASTFSPVWDGSLAKGQVLGVPAFSTGQVPASTLVLGAWDRMLLADWGYLEIMRDPYTAFRTGHVSMRAWFYCDIGIMNPGAFTVATSVT